MNTDSVHMSQNINVKSKGAIIYHFNPKFYKANTSFCSDTHRPAAIHCQHLSCLYSPNNLLLQCSVFFGDLLQICRELVDFMGRVVTWTNSFSNKFWKYGFSGVWYAVLQSSATKNTKFRHKCGFCHMKRSEGRVKRDEGEVIGQLHQDDFDIARRTWDTEGIEGRESRGGNPPPAD